MNIPFHPDFILSRIYLRYPVATKQMHQMTQVNREEDHNETAAVQKL